MRRHPLRATLGVVMAAALLACASGPQPIAYGVDACDYCRMAISDPRFGGELVTSRGKVRKFDAVECLASFYAGARTDVGQLWVSEFRHPGHFIAAERAKYVRAATGPSSPMGQGLYAFAPDADMAAEAQALGGTVLTWDEVLDLVRRQGHGGEAGRVAGGADAR